MSTTTTDDLKLTISVETILTALGSHPDDKDRWSCPFSEQHTNGDIHHSVGIKNNRATCWSQKCFEQADVFHLVGLKEGLASFAEQKKRVLELAGLHKAKSGKGQGLGQIVAEYPYVDEAGATFFQVVRYHPKTFRQRRPDGKGEWIWNLDGTRLVIYKLPEVLKANSILIVEGEKDVETANNLGFPNGWASTCNPMGAKKWRDEYSDLLKGKRVVILPDADKAGEAHADQVAASLDGKAASVSRLTLPDGYKDLSEWAEGKSAADLAALLTTATPWTPMTGSSATMQQPLGVVYRCMNDIQARSIRWLWPGRIARGKVFMIAGHPGLGKSQLTTDLAATVSTGGTFPGSEVPCKAGNVVLFSAEDEADDTIRPRLEAAGANLSKVFILDAVLDSNQAERAFNLKTDLPKLEAVLEAEGGASLIIIDPVTAYLGDTDSHKNAEIRALLAPLSTLAAQYDAAVVCISHFTKAPSGEALLRVMGSLAFVAAVRAAFLVAQDPEEDDRRLFLPLKNNIAKGGTGLAFTIQSAAVEGPDGPIDTSRVVWLEGAVSTTANEVMTAPLDQEERSDLDDAKEFLRGLLAEGPVKSKQIKADAEGAGYAWRTIQRAQSALGVVAFKGGMKEGWLWQLSGKSHAEDSQKPPKASTQNTWQSSDSSGGVGGLQGGTMAGKAPPEDSGVGGLQGQNPTPIPEDSQQNVKDATQTPWTSSGNTGTGEQPTLFEEGETVKANGDEQEVDCVD